MPIIERRVLAVKGKGNEDGRWAGSPDFFQHFHPEQERWRAAPLEILHVENLIDNPIPECEDSNVISSQLSAISFQPIEKHKFSSCLLKAEC
jgi:hypothetical protein